MDAVKSYGRADSSWDRARVRSVLEDALDMAVKHDTSVYVGEDVDGTTVALSDQDDGRIHIFACGVRRKDLRQAKTKNGPRGEFHDNSVWSRYTIDRIIPRAYDCLVNGVIRYGRPEPLSRGRMQIARALKDAKKMIERHGRPFIVGLSKKRDIRVSPMSEKSKFFAPLSFVITKSDFWRISDMHSDIISGIRDEQDFVLMMYYGITDGMRFYGTLEDGRDECIASLESAFEDAVNMPEGHDLYCVGLSKQDIIMQPKWGWVLKYSGCRFWEADPKEFLDGRRLLRERISAAARNAYEDIGHG